VRAEPETCAHLNRKLENNMNASKQTAATREAASNPPRLSLDCSATTSYVGPPINETVADQIFQTRPPAHSIAAPRHNVGTI